MISEKCGAVIPFNYPVVGADSFRTATGVHAAAIEKALSKNDNWLAEHVYCGVPSSMIGREHTIEIGPLSGEHNVRFFLRKNKIEENPGYVTKILEVAKRSNRLRKSCEQKNSEKRPVIWLAGKRDGYIKSKIPEN